MVLVRYRVGAALVFLAVLLLAAAGWLLFVPAHVRSQVQVSADRTTYSTVPSYCDQVNLTLSQSLACISAGLPSSYQPGKSASETFTCSSAWGQWVGHVPYRWGTATYANLTGAVSPATRLYSSPSEADALCGIATRGRTHLFWTLSALAALALIGAALVHRSAFVE